MHSIDQHPGMRRVDAGRDAVAQIEYVAWPVAVVRENSSDFGTN